MTLEPGSTLGPYEILSLLGAGGMGEVYRARDPRLARDVAVKVLPEEFFEGEEKRQRFEREARLLAALNHPNVAAIHSFEEVSGSSPGSSSRHILVMELVDGEPLSKRLRAGPIPMAEALSIGREIAGALEAAHAKGIVHRDLKPGNVMLSKDGRVKLLDFGLAKAFGAEVAHDDVSHSSSLTGAGTSTGVILGTAAYMSPEQARGQRVDARTDIWSFGVVLWELLTGQRLFGGQSTPDTLAAVLRAPVDFKKLPLTTPREVRRLVIRCLERVLEKRLADIGEARRRLESGSGGASRLLPSLTLAGAAAVLILVAAGGAFVARQHWAAGTAGASRRIAVLPFENLGSTEDDHLADGIGDEVRARLTSLASLQVIARGSSTPYKKTTKTQRQIAEELNVSYLLNGTVRFERAGDTNRVRVRPELVEVSGTGAPTSRWQEAFDAATADVFRVQSDIATGVARELGVTFGAGEEKRFLEKPTSNLAAWDAYIKGEVASKNWTGQSELAFYEKAVALDPGFALAWAGVSEVSSMLYQSTGRRPEFAERARQAAEKAVELAPHRPEGHAALGSYFLRALDDPKRAMEEYEKARRIAPGDTRVLNQMGWAEEALGLWDAAVENFKLVARLDPRAPWGHANLGRFLLYARRYPEARDAIDRGLALDPTGLLMIECRAETFLGEGDLAGARASLRTAPKEVDQTSLVILLAVNGLDYVLEEEQRDLLVRLTPSAFNGNRGTWGLCLASVYAERGDAANVRTYAEEARRAFQEELRAGPRRAGNHFVLGISLAYLGRKEEAVREGEIGAALLPAQDNLKTLNDRDNLMFLYVLAGEQERALDELERLLANPHYRVSGAWLRIDPGLDPLRQNPRFRRLVAAR